MDIDLSHLNQDECLKVGCMYVYVRVYSICMYVYIYIYIHLIHKCISLRCWNLTITTDVMRENINNTGLECSTHPNKYEKTMGQIGTALIRGREQKVIETLETTN